MIQRIQTIWLILAGTCAALTFKLPYYYIGANELGIAPSVLTPDGHFFITILTAAILFNALITIFLYKERIVQIRLSIIGILMEILLLFLYYRETKTFTTGTYTPWCILHILILIFFFLAARAINKDDKLVRDSNRLR